MSAAEPLPIRESAFAVTTADRFTLHGTCFAPLGATRGSLVIASALGVPRRLYAGFAAAAAARGVTSWTFDYRGIGDSLRQQVRGRDLRMADWGRHDIDAVLTHAATHAPGLRLLVGHSCGGQLPGLAPASESLDRAVFVAASAPRASLYPRRDRLALHLLWDVAIPLLSIGRDQLPRGPGGSSAQFPAGVSRDWARWARSADYLFHPRHGLDAARYARLTLPILSLGFDDDRYAPSAAIEALLAHYPAAAIERRTIAARQVGGKIGHFGFFRPGMRAALWDPTLDWLLRS